MTECGSEEIDLSHYDLVEQFTGLEAASLIAGVDPHARGIQDLQGTPELGRIQAIREGMRQSYKVAWIQFANWAKTNARNNHPLGARPIRAPFWQKPTVKFETWHISLRSVELLTLWEEWRSGSTLITRERLDQERDFDHQIFHRLSIKTWLQDKSFEQSKYFLSANAILEDEFRTDFRHIEQDPTTTKIDLKKKRDSLYEDASAEPTAAREAKPLGTRERNTLQKIIIAMAIKGYSYNPKALRSDVVSEITKDIESLGLSMDQDTVRKHIQESAKQLP